MSLLLRKTIMKLHIKGEKIHIFKRMQIHSLERIQTLKPSYQNHDRIVFF